MTTFAPRIGSILALGLGGLYHGYRQVRNRRVNEALVQGVETARAVLTSAPQGQAADALFVKGSWSTRRRRGSLRRSRNLADKTSDNPAAKMTAQEIAERVKSASVKRVG